MLNFTIFSSNTNHIKNYKNIVIDALVDKEYFYKFDVFNNDTYGLDKLLHNNSKNNIYIIDQNHDIDGNKIIDKIINVYDDFSSYIIVLDFNKVLDIKEIILMHNFNIRIISDYDNYVEQLKCSIHQVVKLLNFKEKCITFYYNGHLYKIPYSDILYIEKEANSKLCKIVCKSDIYYVNKTIKQVREIVDDTFIQTHRSALINKDNIHRIDITRSRIVFNNKEECFLISRHNKKSLRVMFANSK